ncbi:hypothetical protein L6164_018897 [Bauhinia variegata]|uniref:Uncharacterized protein n=1 Tax=Bauhinia variegata TaxID=167791 RepID=A0ACB9ND61_BAUVA|nr:hypothetical protein L6164_018897 [Bauhinia variegata]
MEKDQVEGNWSETVEDLVATGEIESAISFLESVVSKLEALNTSESGPELQLASVLTDLAKLYSSSGFSLKADELESRAFVIGQKARQVQSSSDLEVTHRLMLFRLQMIRTWYPILASTLDAQNSIRCPFTMRNLDEDDKLLSSIKTKSQTWSLFGKGHKHQLKQPKD